MQGYRSIDHNIETRSIELQLLLQPQVQPRLHAYPKNGQQAQCRDHQFLGELVGVVGRFHKLEGQQIVVDGEVRKHEDRQKFGVDGEVHKLRGGQIVVGGEDHKLGVGRLGGRG